MLTVHPQLEKYTVTATEGAATPAATTTAAAPTAKKHNIAGTPRANAGKPVVHSFAGKSD